VKISHANIALVAASLVAGTAVAQGASKPAAPPLPAAPGPGQSPAKAAVDLALLQQHCSACHSLDTVTAQNKTADDWAETMDRMVDHGMQITPEDSKKVTDFLVAHYGAK
jgi:mono/diheme cytochrome c family protein